LKTKILNIEGMTCAACAKAVERVTKKLQGVENSTVNIATEKLTITYDKGKVNLEDILSSIDKAGYKGTIDTVERIIAIEGMTCATCAKAVERAVKKIEGVMEANVNIATEKLNVIYEPSLVEITDIKQGITKAGYKGRDVEEIKKEDNKSEDESKKLWRRFVISAIFTVPLLYISMGHMMGLHIPQALDPMNHPLTFALIQLLLVIPVMYVGRRFYKVGLKALKLKSPNMDSLISIGTIAAFLYGLFAIYQISKGNLTYAMDLYFESAATILTLITLGKYLESVSKGHKKAYGTCT